MHMKQPTKSLLAILISASWSQAMAQAAPQLPTAGKVVAGQANIQQSGNALNINQSSNRAAIDWATFNVGATGQVNFNQPSASAVTLNRVLDTNASQIMGRINAPGQVFIVNPNGVLFGPNSQVDVGGLIATTQNMSNADFMAGKSTFEGNGSGGASVVNQGQLNAALGGYIALLAPSVRNEGVIVAREGTVALAAGDKSVIEFSGTRMVSVLVDRAVMDALVENKQIVRADGGLVIFSARSANAVLSSVINNSGSVQANSVVNRNGRILLEGGEQGVVSVSGSLQAKGEEAGTQGGSVVVTGDKVQLTSTANLDASGQAGGGSVLVGGGWQGQDPSIRQANAVVIEAGAQLNASAIDNGDGGTVVAWSNTQKEGGVTRVAGNLLARGGANGGNGGKIETSGHYLSTSGASGDASAIKGSGGQWLFDPYNVTITSTTSTGNASTGGVWTPSASPSEIKNTDINNLLNAGTNVVVSTGLTSSSAGTDEGNITVNSAITGTGAGGSAKLTLTANKTIDINSAISLAGSGSMVELNAGSTSTAGGVTLDAAVTVDTLSVNVKGAGAIAQTQAVNVNNLKLTGSTTNATLAHADNRIGTLAADLASLNLVNNTGSDLNSIYGTGMYVGTVDGLSGIKATGTINVAMKGGNIFLDKNIATTDTSTSAITLNAGADLLAGTTPQSGVNPYGWNIVRLGTSTITVGTNGRATLYTGSVDGGAATLNAYVASTGLGRFRYNSDNTGVGHFNYTTALGTGLYVITRQQPMLDVASSASRVYGSAITLTPTFSGYLNGDTLATSVINQGSVSIGGATSTAGFYVAGDHALTSSGATGGLGYGFNYLAGTLTVTKKPLTVVASANNKVYDSTTAATAQLSSDKLDADLVNLTSTRSVFSDKNVGAGKTVTVSGIALSSGADAGNYLIVNPGATATSTASITAKAIQGIYVAANKVYDGTTAATVTGTSTQILAGDTVTFVNPVATFASKDAVAAGTQVNMTAISLGGTDGANYSVANPTAMLSAVISPKSVTPTFTGTAKTYDGNVNAVVIGVMTDYVASDGVTYAGTTASFVDKNVGVAKQINVSGLSIVGTGASNYTLTATTATTTADINKKTLTVTGVTAADKVYDGTKAAALNTAAVTYGGLVSGDAVVLNAVGTFADKNVGIGKTVNIASTYTGEDVGNYTFVNQASTTAGISVRSLAVTAMGVDKVYDGTRTATYSLVSNQVAGDGLTIRASSGVFDSKDVVGSQTVTIGGITVTGTDAANYSLQNTSTTTTAQITPKALSGTVTASNKPYDGSAAADATLSNLSGFVGQETVTASAPGATFNSANVLEANTVTVNSVQLANGTNGGLATNYMLAAGQSVAASITPKELTATATAANKIYDGTTNALLQTTMTITGGLVGNEHVTATAANATFNSKDVASANLVTVNQVALSDDAGSGGKASNYSLSAGQTSAAHITEKSLTATTTAENKVYDGSRNATATLALSGLIGSETLSVANAATFNSKDVATATQVTVDSVQLSDGSNGGKASNYSLDLGQIASASASITPKQLTANATAIDKPYDASLAASATMTNLSGFVNSETVTATATDATFNSKDVLTANQVTVNQVTLADGVSGGLATNYALAAGQTAVAHITPRVLTGTLTVPNKVYDGTTSAAGTLAISGLVNGETLAVVHSEQFNSKNVLDANVVTVNSVSLSNGDNGGLASNYALVSGQTNTTARITPKVIQATYQGVDKEYDGTTDAVVVGASSGLIAGDTVGIANSPTSFGDKNAGAGKALNVTGINLTGADASNYSLLASTATTSATITPKALTVSGITAADKTYDGSVIATVNAASVVLDGKLSGDAVNLSTSTGVFDSKNAGQDKTVNLTNAYSGADVGNYQIADQTTTRASVSPKSLTVSGVTVSDKTFDDSVTATINTSNTAYVGRLNGDDVRVNSLGAFIDKSVGQNKAVILAYTGADSANYVITNTDNPKASISAAVPEIAAPVALVMPSPGTAPSSASPTLSKSADMSMVKTATPAANAEPVAVSAPVQPATDVAASPVAPVPAVMSPQDVRQFQAIKPAQIAKLDAAQLGDMLSVMTPKQLMAITPDQMGALQPEKLAELVNLLDKALSKAPAK
jgi:trimeric autotransporter adhesin